jgi:hypothetical protein
MDRHARILPWLALALALCAAGGCGLFSTRSPESPGSGSSSIPTNFTAPESTLATLGRAVHERSQSVYGLCLADTVVEQRDFHVHFDPSDIVVFEQSGQQPPADWTRDLELTFFPQFVAYQATAKYDVYFNLDPGPGNIVFVGGATQKYVYNEHYRVWAGGTPVCAGAAYLSFERVGGSTEYKLTFWDDRRDTASVRTWGFARLTSH